MKKRMRRRSQRKFLIISCLVSVVFIWAVLWVCHNSADARKNWWYIAQDVMGYMGNEKVESAPDEERKHYYRSEGVLYSYSLAEPNPEKICEMDNAKDYVVCDEAVFWAIWLKGGDEGSQIWRYDRRSDTYGLYLESDVQIYHLTVYDGCLIFGDLMHFCVLPLDGDPKEDVFDLRELFADRRQSTAEYGDWHIGRSDDKMMYILDKNTGEIILDNNYSLETWMTVDGRLLNFTVDYSGHYYRWEGEDEKHRIQCLDREDTYKNSVLWPADVSVKGTTLIGMLTVSGNSIDGGKLSQKDVKRDILFKVDLANHTSEVFYRTPNNRTRILGYHDGYVCLLKGSVICTESLTGKDRREIYDLRDEEWYSCEKDGSGEIYFGWDSGELTIRTTVDGESWIKRIPVSDIKN